MTLCRTYETSPRGVNRSGTARRSHDSLDPILISKHRAKMEFCIRDDDTSYFTMPDDLEKVYGPFTKGGPVSLAVVPFHRAGTSGCVPDQFRGRGTVHPLHENQPLVRYLRNGVSTGRFEIMLHGYHHDESNGVPEFLSRTDLSQRISRGRKYLEDLLGTQIRVFVPPGNAIGAAGLRAIASEGLHLGGTAGVRSGWSPVSFSTWRTWLYLRKWRKSGGRGVPWILDLGDHREIQGNAVTPAASFEDNQLRFRTALAMGGVFCVATHYWEMKASSIHKGAPSVGEHLSHFVRLATANPQIVWRTVGDVVSRSEFVA